MNHQPQTTNHQPPSTNRHDWLKDVLLWLPLACVSWLLAWKYQDQFISDWDGFDYTAQVVSHLPSALGLGRALFLGYNYALWEVAHRWLHVPPEQAYLVLRYGVMAQTGFAVVGVYALCKEVTVQRAAAFAGASLVVASPMFILYSGRAMSEIPGLLMLAWSLWWMLRSLRRGRVARFVLAAALMGLSANVREFAVFYLPLIPLAAWLYGVRLRWIVLACAVAAICAGAGMIFWANWQGENYVRAVRKWYALSAAERKVHPVTAQNAVFLARYAFHCSAVTAVLAPLAMAWVWMRRRLRPLALLGSLGLLADLVMLANHDLSVNPRYLLTGMLGLVAVCGWCLAELIRWQRWRVAPLLLGLLVLTKLSYNFMAKELYDQQWSARAARAYLRKIEGLPWNSGFIIGSRTPLISFYVGVGAQPHWRTIAPGASWPDERLGEAIQDFYYAGRLVFVDFDPELWQVGERKENREAAGLEMIRREYELEWLRDSFYRVVRRKASTEE